MQAADKRTAGLDLQGGLTEGQHAVPVQVADKRRKCLDVKIGVTVGQHACRNAGSSLLQRPRAIESIVRSMSAVLSCPLTIKVRKGFMDNKDVAHTFLPSVKAWGGSAVTLHGRSRQQR